MLPWTLCTNRKEMWPFLQGCSPVSFAVGGSEPCSDWSLPGLMGSYEPRRGGEPVLAFPGMGVLAFGVPCFGRSYQRGFHFPISSV